MLVNRVERGRYLDSVALMRVSRRLEAQAGVEAAALMIGSPSNKALLREAGLLAPSITDPFRISSAGSSPALFILPRTESRPSSVTRTLGMSCSQARRTSSTA